LFIQVGRKSSDWGQGLFAESQTSGVRTGNQKLGNWEGWRSGLFRGKLVFQLQAKRYVEHKV
jgi:hypothetical protein